MKKILLFGSILMLTLGLFAQEVTTLTFTAKQQNEAYQKLDSVVITNLTRQWTEILVYPDTLLTLNTVGIANFKNGNENIRLSQNIPNPFQGITHFNLTLSHKEKIELSIFDINGKKVAEYHNTLSAGEHQFRATMSTPQTYLLSASTKNGTTSIKMINLSNQGEQARIEYLSSLPLSMDMTKKQSQNIFAQGDSMMYVGYASQRDSNVRCEISQMQQGSDTVIFTFPTERPLVKTKLAVKSATNIMATSCDIVCELISAEGETILERGLAWARPQDSKRNHIADKEVGEGEYTIHVDSMESGTSYVFLAYANTTNGLVYSADTTISFPKASVPIVKIDSVFNVTNNAASMTAHIEADGNLKITEIGFVYDTLGGKGIILKQDKITDSFTGNLKGLKSATKYYVKAYAINAEGTAYSAGSMFTTEKGSDCSSVKDIEGNEYKTVQIGTQCWMAENMKSTTYANGTKLSSGFTKYDDPNMGTLVYYSWAMATNITANSDMHKNDVQGICPQGWHIPCYDDFNTLCKTVDPSFQEVTTRGTSSLERASANGLAIKLCAPKSWTSSTTPNTPGYYSTDSTGFNTTGFGALPIGYADPTVHTPGSCHLWSSVKGSSQGDVFKFTASSTGILWQWNMNTKTYCGVRCIMNSENSGGSGGTDPEDTLSLNGKYVIFSEQATRSYQIYDITNPSKPVWQWRAQQDGGYSTFNNPSDVKPVYNGTCMMAVASGGGAAIVRIKDKKVLFYANVTSSNNPHSIELLPNNRVVIASSTGNKLTVYTIDTTKVNITTKTYERYFDCGHNVVWDEGRKCLWSAGKSNLEKMSYNETTGELTTIKTFPFPEGNTYAHDFIKIYGKDQYHMTTEEHTYVFDPTKETFTLCEGENTVNVKSISSGPEGYPTICAIPLSGYGTNNRTWVTKYVLNFNTGAKLMELPGSEIYKLRWWVWEK